MFQILTSQMDKNTDIFVKRILLSLNYSYANSEVHKIIKVLTGVDYEFTRRFVRCSICVKHTTTQYFSS